MPARRLEDRIRELCARAIYERGTQWRATILELQQAIREHALRASNLNAAATISGNGQLVRERRR